MPTVDDGLGDQTHVRTALRLLVVQTIAGVGAGGILAGVLLAATHLDVSGALFVAGVVVAIAGTVWSLGVPMRAVPWTLGVARMDDPTSISRRPTGTSQADAVLVVSSIVAGLLLVGSAVVAH
ncbi:MAG TPA: hypothetical protein VGH92_07285 [Gaiellaceae bacterium]